MALKRKTSLIPSFIQNRIAGLPQGPGIYYFKDDDRRIIYIGKAVSIKKRVTGHYRFFGRLNSKEGVMLSQTRRIDYLETLTEAEALLLEAALVKEHLPKYNQALRDDKSYPYLKITDEDFPRLLVVRRRKADGGTYFGPYVGGKLLHAAVKMLRKEFPMRVCRTCPNKTCLWYHLGQCPGPCENEIDHSSYKKTVRELQHFLEGRREALVRNLTRRMKEYSHKQEYEKAKGLYEEIKALGAMPLSPRSGTEISGRPELLRKALGLSSLPRRIECFDISNIHGKEAVGSMVVFEDGRPKRCDYRRFKIRQVRGIDDYRMMQEVIRRRYCGSLSDRLPIPDLIVIDGGKGHLAAVLEELSRSGSAAGPALVSIAKEHEHLFLPARASPIVLSPASPALQLVRHLRDEAHRFAIQYHRRLHRKESMFSLLDQVAGVGPKTKEKILLSIGSIRKITRMTPAELRRKAKISQRLAQSVKDTITANPCDSRSKNFVR